MRIDRLLWPQMPGSAYEFHFARSPVHKLSPAFKLLFSVTLSAAAFGAREKWSLAVLLLVNISLYLLARLRLIDLWRDIRFFLIQGVIVLALYVIRYGIAEGVPSGLRVGVQILLFFMPGAIFLRTTNSLRLTKSLRRIFSPRFAFVVLCSFRFVPVFVREFQEIWMAQRLRGTPLSARQMLNPLNWRRIPDCLFVPLIVRAMRTADEASLSAEGRGMLAEADASFSKEYLQVNMSEEKDEAVCGHR